MNVRAATARLLLIGAAGLSIPAARADDAVPDSGPELLAEKADATLALDSENKLVLVGLQGRLVLRLGAPGQLRFAARSLAGPRDDRSVALWGEGRTLRLSPVRGKEAERLLVEVGIPPELNLEVEAAASQIDLSSLLGTADVRGRDLQITVSSLKGAASFDLQGGRLVAKGAADLTIEGRKLALDLQGVTGGLNLRLVESNVELAYTAEVDAHLEATEFVAADVRGRLGVQAEGGSLKLKGCVGGGDLNLSGAALELAESKGGFEVQTDASAAFRLHEGDLHVVAQGAPVRALQITGALDLEVDNAEVALEELSGPTHVRGRDLKLLARTSHGDLTIDVSSSEVLIENAMTKLSVENEYGSITIHGALDQVEVSSRNGEVHVEDLKGSLQLEADGPDVVVQWTQVTGWERSSVTNASGDVHVGLPPQASFRLEASAPYGRVENDLPGVQVSEDGHSASAVSNAARSAPQIKHAAITVKAGGDLYLSGGGAPNRPAPRR